MEKTFLYKINFFKNSCLFKIMGLKKRDFWSGWRQNLCSFLKIRKKSNIFEISLWHWREYFHSWESKKATWIFFGILVMRNSIRVLCFCENSNKFENNFSKEEFHFYKNIIGKKRLNIFWKKWFYLFKIVLPLRSRQLK